MTTWWDVLAARKDIDTLLSWACPTSIFKCLQCGLMPDAALLTRLRSAPLNEYGQHELIEACLSCCHVQSRRLEPHLEIVNDIEEIDW